MDIVHSVLQLKRACTERNYGNVLTVLGDLDKVAITTEQLETTDVVKVLYGILKTCPQDNTKRAAKALLSRWKKQYCKDNPDKLLENNPGLQCASANVEERRDHKGSSTSTVKYGLQAVSQAAGGVDAAVRSKCIEFLFTSLCPEPADEAKASDLACAIEHHIHERHKANPFKYKACVRSKVANLRNPKSQHLRQGLLCASLSPLTFAHMSTEEMASAELRQLRKEYTSRGVRERQLPQGALR